MQERREKMIISQVSIPYSMLFYLLLSLLFGLGLILIRDSYLRREDKMIILFIIILVFLLIIQNNVEYFLMTGPTRPVLRTTVSVLGYVIRPIPILLFHYIIVDRKKVWQAWILAFVNLAVHLSAFFSPVVFRITNENTFVRGPLGYTCHLVTAMLLINLFFMTIKYYVRLGKAGAGIPVFNTILIIASVVLDSVVLSNVYPISLLTSVMVVVVVLYYIWLHQLFFREHEQDLEAQQRIRIMMTQIQPHFLYNTLSTIRALCRQNPEMAAEITEKFGIYLRQNLDSLSMTGLIPFRKELEHTQTYTDIEMVRFENIRVEYDIQEFQFSVPPLTLQPIVENAIRHGVRIREEGLIRVTTRKADDQIEICVSDNGVGFDTEKIESQDSGHIGIRNVRTRVEEMCGGSLRIESSPHKGTKVWIFLPDRGEEA